MQTTCKENLDVIHITEAGLKQKLPDVMKGYKAVIHERPEHNIGSVMWVKDYYHNRVVRVDDPEDNNIGSEIIHVLLDRLPPTNIMGVYQETRIASEQIEDAHRVWFLLPRCYFCLPPPVLLLKSSVSCLPYHVFIRSPSFFVFPPLSSSLLLLSSSLVPCRPNPVGVEPSALDPFVLLIFLSTKVQVGRYSWYLLYSISLGGNVSIFC